MSRLRYKRRRIDSLQEISLTPLIDTALTLLIIFMITSPMLHNGIKVDVPQGGAKQDPSLSQQIVIVIDKDQNIFYRDHAVRLEDLAFVFESVLLEQTEGTVCVKADQALSYGFVMYIIEHIKMVQGVKHVVLVTKKIALKR